MNENQTQRETEQPAERSTDSSAVREMERREQEIQRGSTAYERAGAPRSPLGVRRA